MKNFIQKQIEEIINGFECPKGLVCYKSRFKNLCKARDVGLKSFVACLAEDPLECKFSIQFTGVFFCQCPLRVYIAKRLKR